MIKSDEHVGKRAKRLFDESVEGLDAATLSLLNRSRQAALEAASQAGRWWYGWIPATGFATVVLLAMIAMRGPGGTDIIVAPAVDFDIVVNEASIEMLEELEFYSWLGSQEPDIGNDVG